MTNFVSAMPAADERADLKGTLHTAEPFCGTSSKPASSVMEKLRAKWGERHNLFLNNSWMGSRAYV